MKKRHDKVVIVGSGPAGYTAAIYAAGYGSPSRFYERSTELLGMPPRSYARGGQGQSIRWDIGESWLGHVLVAATDRGICTVLLGSAGAETFLGGAQNDRVDGNAGVDLFTGTDAGDLGVAAIQVGGTVLFDQLPPTRYILLLSVLLLLVVSVLMVGLGWSARTARLGTVWGLTVVLGIYSLGMAWGATGLRTPAGWELWWPDKRPAQADLLLKTVNEQSEWSAGDATSQDVTLLDIDLGGESGMTSFAIPVPSAPAEGS